jgi:hypothetical protein
LNIARKFEINNHILFPAALPFENSDDAFNFKTIEGDIIVVIQNKCSCPRVKKGRLDYLEF